MTTEVKQSLRDLRIQLALLNHHLSGQGELRDVDLDCLDIISRQGPLSPSALARSAGHPATMTGILDRLEHGGWVARGATRPTVEASSSLRDRTAELLRLYAGMSRSMDDICAGHDTELELLADFLRRTTDAGPTSAEDLA